MILTTRPKFLLATAALALCGTPGPAAHAADAAVLPSPPALNPADMDRGVKSSDDFYHFAGGGWLKTNAIPPDQTRWGSFSILQEHNRDVLHGILDECAAYANDLAANAAKGEKARLLFDPNKQKVGDFYASGMDEATVNAEGIKPLAPYLAKIDALKDAAGLPALLADLHLKSVSALFDFGVEADEKNSETDIAQLSQGGLGLPDRDYYLLDDEHSKGLRTQYEAHLTRMFTLLGDPADKAAAEAKSVLAFETELAKASKTRVDLRDPQTNYHKMTVDELTKAAPGFEWKAYLTDLGSTDPGSLDVGQPEFVTAAVKLAASAPLGDVKNYLRWHVIHTAAPYISQPFVDENFAFYGKALTGAPQNLPRWKRVLATTDAGLGEALGQFYVAKTFPPEAKARALAEVKDLMAALREKLANIDWMGAQTRTAALNKLDHFTVKIGYPDKWRDYSKLDVKRQPYVLNVMAANEFESQRRIAKINQPVDKTEWGMTPPTVNAYYNPTRNEIVFPAGILQPPFFNATADDAVNYGGIGAVIGHEMTHGFDDQGRQYDAEGNLKDWWTAEDKAHFDERANKIVKQFYAYEIAPGEHVNGKLTEGENIADMGGIKIAYAALEKALDRQGAAAHEKQIDGFTPEQRYFLGWAQVWRINIRPEEARRLLKIDPHSPTQFRCNGPLSNLPEFQKAFNAPDGSPMVRPADERVQIW